MAYPPYPTWRHVIDAGWVFSVMVATIWVRLLRALLCMAFAALSVFLISDCFLFGSFGGMDQWLPL